MELTKKDVKSNQDAKLQMVQLATKEFIAAITAFSNVLKEDVAKLTTIQKENEKEIIAIFDKQLDFIESHKQEELTIEAKVKIYDDFNKVASKLGDYKIQVYKESQKEKNIKQVLQGATELAKIVTVGSIAWALIKKIK